jgi:polyferredoxin
MHDAVDISIVQQHTKREAIVAKVKVKQLAARQRYRKALLFISFLLFPATLYYMSPYLIIMGASEGIINGSFIVFGLMFVAALFVGRLWCGWACPAGAMQAFGMSINNRRVRGRRIDWIKWAIWIPWLAVIVAMAVRAGGYHSVESLYQLESGVTLLQEGWYFIYYVVLFLFAILAIVIGRRASCHTICWMAPFMILGRRIRNVFRWPSLRLQAEQDRCIECKRCTRDCPMSLDVHQMVRANDMENDECILCGTCVDNCPKSAIRFPFSAGG